MKNKIIIIPIAKDTIFTDRFFNKVRERLSLTEKQLPNNVIKEVVKLNGELINEWVINNVDGFKMGKNGRFAISKYTPKILREDRNQKIEELLNHPKLSENSKKLYIKRYEKSLNFYKDSKKNVRLNLHSYFSQYKYMWFNSRNTEFKKAEMYEFVPRLKYKLLLAKKILEGKDYIEWNFSDFRETKKTRKEENIRRPIKNKSNEL